MKLPQSEIRTNCLKCIFAKFDKLNQIDCSAGRLNKFKDLNVAILHKDDINERSWFLLKRFCNMYREKQQSMEDARKQITTTFSIVIYDNDNTSNLDKAIESIKRINYDKSKFKVVISSVHKDKSYELFHIVNQLNSNDINTELVINLDDPKSDKYNSNLDKDAFTKCVKSAYIIKMSHNDTVYSNMLLDIDTSLNDKLETITIYESNKIGRAHV